MQEYFDQPLERRGTASVKWDLTEMFLGYPDLLPFSIADMDFRSPPEVIAALTERVQAGVYGYNARLDTFFEAIQGWFARRHGWQIERDWISATAGVVPSLHIAVRAFARPGDAAVLMTPAYYPLFSVISLNGLNLLENPLQLDDTGYTIDVVDLERKLQAARLLIFCNPHNPGGRVWRRDELARIVELCVRHDVLIISDDIHCDLLLSARYTPIATIDPAASSRIVTCLSPSKTFNLSGLHSSFMVIPDADLRAQFELEKQRMGYFFGNIMGDVALIAAYTHGDAWLDALLEYLRANLAYLAESFVDHPQIRLYQPEGTYLAWLDARALGLREAEIARRLAQEAGIGLERGSVFGTAGEGFVRLNFATPRQMLRQAVAGVLKVFPS
jgi:cysteine-S-conjugate beta-lyase